MTHARWVLLRPPDEWTTLTVRDALLGLNGLTPTLSLNGWDLLHVERTPQHPEWFAAIAAGRQTGRTVLGTPLAPIAEDAARGTVEGVGAVPPAMIGGSRVPLQLRVRNLGSAVWPTALPPGAPPTQAVCLLALWWPSGVRHERALAAVSADLSILRDLSPGETAAQRVWVPVPEAPGTYDFEIAVEQVDGARFDQPGNQPLRARVTVVPG
jgi:hypothetical protein